MGVGVENPLAAAAYQLGEARSPAVAAGCEVGTQHQGVDEEADQPFELGALAARHRRAEGEVALAGVAAQEGREGGDGGHEAGGPLALADLGQRCADGRRKLAHHLAPRSPLHRRPRPVGGQLELRQGGQLAAPEVELAIELRAGQPGALPDGEVGVLDGQGRQRGGATAGGRRAVRGRRRVLWRAVQRRQLAPEDAQRRAVGDDVMGVVEEYVLVVAQAQQAETPQRPGGEIERRCGVAACLARRLGAAARRRKGGEVDPRQRHRRRRQHPLLDLAVAARGRREDGAQRLLATGEGGERRRQGAGVEGAEETQRRRHAVGGAAGVEAVEEPQPLLREGGRQRLVARRRHQGRQQAAGLGAALGVDPARQGGHRRRLEQAPHRKLDAEPVAQPRHQAGGEQRVATEEEEVVVDPHRRLAVALQTEHLGEDLGQQPLGRRAWRGVGTGGPLGLDGGEGLAVELAVRGQRQRVEHHPGGRHQRLGQGEAQVGGELAGVEGGGVTAAGLARRVRLGSDVGDQAAVVLAGTADGEHRRFAHRRVAAQRRLDLPQLDAEAAHLDLVVAATQVVQLATRQPAHPVAGGVHPPPRLGGERVRQPALRGQPRAAQVAARQPGAGQVQLPRHPRRHRPQTAVEPVGPAAGQRPADLRLALAARHQPPGRVGGVLRRAVQVVQALDVVEAVHRVGEAARQRLAGQVHRHHRARHRAAAHQLGHRRRHRVDQRHRLPRRVPRQAEGVVRQHHPPTGRQRHEQLVDRQVEAHRGRRQDTRQLRRRVPRQGPPHHRHRAGVGDRDALGHAGRARGVDQVGQVGSMNRRALSPELVEGSKGGVRH